MRPWAQVALCSIQRDPNVWSRADDYIPERWIEGSPEAASEAQKKVRAACACSKRTVRCEGL
jgi:cytochrome P450